MHARFYVKKRMFFLLLCGWAFCGHAERGNTLTIINNTAKKQMIYVQLEQARHQPLAAQTKTYYKNTLGCIFPTDPYSGQGNDHTCHMLMAKSSRVVVALGAAETHLNPGKLMLSVSAGENHYPQGPCNTTLAEFTLDDQGRDTYDISLVNGQNFNMSIEADNGNQAIHLNSANLALIKNTLGVYPPGCSRCVDGIGVPPAWQGDPQKNTQNCPGYGKAPGPMPLNSCKAGKEMEPKPNACQVTYQPTGANYTVTFNDK